MASFASFILSLPENNTKALENDKIWRFIASGRRREGFFYKFFIVFVLIASHFGIK